MILELAKDLSDALAVLPAKHPKQRMLGLLEEAIRRDIHFIDRHPTTLFQCIWNTCWWYDCYEEEGNKKNEDTTKLECASSRIQCPGFQELLEMWDNERQGCPYWLRADAPLPAAPTKVAHFEKPSPIQAFCSYRGMVAVASPTGTAETYIVPPGVSVFSRKLNGEHITSLAMSPYSDVLAFRDADGVIGIEGYSATLRGRSGKTPFLVRSNGPVVAVNEQNALIAWFPAEGRSETLVEDVPFPICVLRDCRDKNGILFVAGTKEQKIGIVTQVEGMPQIRIVEHCGHEIIDADVDFAQQRIVLLLKNRSIRVTDLSMTNIVAEIFYQREHSQLTGSPLKCVLSDENVCFVTSYGRVGRWNWQTSRLTHVASCYEKTEHQPISIFDILQGEARLLISFPTHAITVDITQSYQGTVKHNGRPTQCISSSDHDVFVSISEDENMIRLFSRDLVSLGAYPWPKPTCVMYSDYSQEFIIGNRSGYICHLPLSGTGGPTHDFRIASHPIVNIMKFGNRECMAVDASGECFELSGRQLPRRASNPRESSRTQLKAFSSGDSDNVWSLYECGNTWTFSCISAHGKEDIVVTSGQRIWDAVTSPSGQRVCIAGDATTLYERRGKIWVKLAYKTMHARLTVFVGDEFVAIVSMEQETCVKIYRAVDFILVATIDIGHRISCMVINGRFMIAGLESGHLVSMSLQGSTQVKDNNGG